MVGPLLILTDLAMRTRVRRQLGG
ncbi:hypothetical protein LINPERHAP1_LOCUS38240 [Linum perenne]